QWAAAAAHEHFLQALGYLQRYDNEASVDGAISLLRQLVESGEESAQVHGALGRSYLFKYRLTLQSMWAELAREACERALALDSRSPEVRVTLGELFRLTGKYPEAIREYQRALKLRENFADATLGLGSALASAGRFSEAEAALRAAIELR